MASPGTGLAQTCADPAHALGVSRVIEIDTSAGPIFGDMTKRDKEPGFLAPKEVVLTFDDGPVPRITTPILDTLDKFCTKATFFSVGEMAIAYSNMVKQVLARGHTLGSHTWSHPMNLRSLSVEKATEQIERGLAAVALAAGQPIAPFFRFPGLSDSDALLSHLQTRGIASFTVDVVSNDSYIGSPTSLMQHTLKEVEARQGGILLFHDIKAATARALPAILTELKARGYTVVHLRAKATATPVASYDTELKELLAKTIAAGGSSQIPLAFSEPAGPLKAMDGTELSVTQLAPVPRPRMVATTESTPPPDAIARPRKSRVRHAHRKTAGGL
jgi:peptidoglycan/xylan/chitin deacetylase (PgdA/CDA1 family)